MAGQEWRAENMESLGEDHKSSLLLHTTYVATTSKSKDSGGLHMSLIDGCI